MRAASTRPVIVHVATRKGMGYGPAESDEAEQMHSTGIIDPQTGLATSVAAPGWTSVFSDELIKRAAKRRDVVAITAAMPGPTGLSAFRKRFPDRFFDVGIAEQHAMTSAAGLAMGGMHPVVAIYSTFLNRAFDQMMMDVALHRSAGHDGARPRRRDRTRRRQPQRGVGHVDARHRAGHARRGTA